MLRVQLWIWRLRFFHIPHQNDTLNWRSHASFNIPHLIFQAQFQCGRGACHLNQARSRYIERCLRFTAVSWMSHCHFRFWIQWRYPQQEPILSHLETNQSKIHIQQHLCVRYAACFVSSFFRTWCGCHDVVGCFCGQAHMAPTSFWGAKSVMSACVFQVSICKANHRQFTELTFLSPVCIPCLKGPMHCQCSGMDSSMLNCETDKKINLPSSSPIRCWCLQCSWSFGRKSHQAVGRRRFVSAVSKHVPEVFIQFQAYPKPGHITSPNHHIAIWYAGPFLFLICGDLRRSCRDDPHVSLLQHAICQDGSSLYG